MPCLPNLPRISAKEIVSQGLHEAANVPGFEIVVTSGSFAALHSRQCPLKAMLVENKPEQRVHSEIGSGERRFRSTGGATKRNRKETGELIGGALLRVVFSCSHACSRLSPVVWVLDL